MNLFKSDVRFEVRKTTQERAVQISYGGSKHSHREVTCSYSSTKLGKRWLGMNLSQQLQCSFSSTILVCRSVPMFRALQPSLKPLRQNLTSFRKFNCNPISFKPSFHNPAFTSYQECTKAGNRYCSSSSASSDPTQDDEMTRQFVETSHERIFDNNRKWVDAMKASDPEYFVKLSSGQIPDYL